MDFKKGNIVEIMDNGKIKKATVKEDGVDSKNRVRVRVTGFPMDMSISLDSNKPVYIVQ